MLFSLELPLILGDSAGKIERTITEISYKIRFMPHE